MRPFQVCVSTQKSPDVLCDATGLRGHDLALPQTVQECGLAMIHMTHDGDHWGAWHQAGQVRWWSEGQRKEHLIK